MYTDLAAALARAKERSGATTADDAYLTELLMLSAGIDAQGETQYRPFLVAARYLEQNRGQQTLKKAKDGVEFTGLAKPIESLLATQASIDKALKLIVPDGFEAITPDCVTCDGQAATALPRFGTRSHSTQVRP